MACIAGLSLYLFLIVLIVISIIVLNIQSPSSLPLTLSRSFFPSIITSRRDMEGKGVKLG